MAESKELKLAKKLLRQRIRRFESRGFVIDTPKIMRDIEKLTKVNDRLEDIQENLSKEAKDYAEDLIKSTVINTIRENLPSYAKYILNFYGEDGEKELVSYEEGIEDIKKRRKRKKKPKDSGDLPGIGGITYQNVYEDFISLLRTEISPPPVRKNRADSKRWKGYLALQKEQRYLLTLIRSEVEQVGEDEVGKRLAEAPENVTEKLNFLLYAASDEDSVNEASNELARIIVGNRELTLEENVRLTEEAEEMQEIY